MATFYRLAADQIKTILETVPGVVNSSGNSNIHIGKRPEIYNTDIKDVLKLDDKIHAWFICREQIEGSYSPQSQVPQGHSHDTHSFAITLKYGGIRAGQTESETEFQELIEHAFDAFMETRSYNFGTIDSDYVPGEQSDAPYVTDFEVTTTRFGVTYQATIHITPTTRKRRDYN